MEEEIREVRDKVSHLSPEERPTVFHLLWHDPLWTAGKDTFVNEFITIAGGKMHLLIYLAMSLWIWKSLFAATPTSSPSWKITEKRGSLSYQFLLSDSRLKVVNAIQTQSFSC